jgi:hypothetical protein
VQVQIEPAAAGGATRSSRLVACCLLDGGVRASPLVAESGRSVLDLDVGPDRRVLDVWLDALMELEWDVERPLVRVLHGGTCPAPASRAAPGMTLDIRADGDAYRGPAGVVRDGLWDQPADGSFLVCEAGRYIRGGLVELVRRHQGERADVTIARDADGAPAGLLVVERAMLDVIAERGFVDLKEQWLGRIVARGARVQVHDLPRGAAMSIRTRLDLLQAARAEAGVAADGQGPEACRARARLARRLTPGWSVSRRATIGNGAVVARSIVMEGAVVGQDAVVSSSLVLPGGVVAPGSLVIDRVVGRLGE